MTEEHKNQPIDPLLRRAMESGNEGDAILLLAKRIHDLKNELATLIGELHIDLDNVASVEHVEGAITRFGRRLRYRTAIILLVIVGIFFWGYISRESDQRSACHDRNDLRAAIIEVNHDQPLKPSTIAKLVPERC